MCQVWEDESDKCGFVHLYVIVLSWLNTTRDENTADLGHRAKRSSSMRLGEVAMVGRRSGHC